MHQAKRGLLCFALAACALITAAPAAEDKPPSVLHALQAYSAQFDGTVVFERRYASRLKYPGHDEHRVLESTRVREGKKIVAVRLHTMTIDDSASSAADIAKEQHIAEKALPYEGAQEFPLGGLLSGTHYESSLPCTTCGADVVIFPFRALVKDVHHANGTLYVDLANSRIIKAEFSPVVMPKPATEGKTIITFGNAAPGMWDIVQIDQRYSGRQMLIKGTFEALIVHDHYRKYPSLEEAKKALER